MWYLETYSQVWILAHSLADADYKYQRKGEEKGNEEELGHVGHLIKVGDDEIVVVVRFVFVFLESVVELSLEREHTFAEVRSFGAFFLESFLRIIESLFCIDESLAHRDELGLRNKSIRSWSCVLGGELVLAFSDEIITRTDTVEKLGRDLERSHGQEEMLIK